KIISHRLFNRLRRIRQNTFLYNVFPSANHTRFEHSIGVMHLASEMFLNAFHNASTHKNKQAKYKIKGNANILSIEMVQNFEMLFFDLRIAALMHDIGHGPMSHLFDKFAPANKDFFEMIRNNDGLTIDNENLGTYLVDALERLVIKNSNLDHHVEHEFVSYYFTLIVLKDLNFSANRI